MFVYLTQKFKKLRRILSSKHNVAKFISWQYMLLVYLMMVNFQFKKKYSVFKVSLKFMKDWKITIEDSVSKLIRNAMSITTLFKLTMMLYFVVCWTSGPCLQHNTHFVLLDCIFSYKLKLQAAFWLSVVPNSIYISLIRAYKISTKRVPWN